ncbi:MAG: serine/threonine protein kinase [Polyangiaceae bacterium]|nr:serine/threonine protein kinase [Polyangiaceae bacterium]
MSSFGPGAVIAGKYRLISLLGKGAMGEVWRAEHVTLGAHVAVKLIDLDLLGPGTHSNSEVVQRFFREAKAAAALRSPHVVQILDHGYDGQLPYIAMEMLEGETLEDRLERMRVLPPLMTATVITHVARAIGKAHEAGIVHRDLKPGNVFLVKNDDEEVAKVLDFGIAKATTGALGAEGGVSTRTGSVVGTPCYMSPEQALGNKSIDYRADLWSLGVIAFECICGVRPFDSEALGDLIVQICARPLPIPSQVVATTGVPIPDGFDAWFAKACAREPNERFQSARELAESLRFLLVPDGSGIFSLGVTGTSMPRIVVPPQDRVSLAGVDGASIARTHVLNPNTMTHPGVAAAVTSAPNKGVRSAVIVASVATLIAVGVGIGVFATMGGQTASNPSPAESGATPTATPSMASAAPSASEIAPADSAPADAVEAAPSATAVTDAAPSATAPTTKPLLTKPISTKKTTTKKSQGWGF